MTYEEAKELKPGTLIEHLGSSKWGLGLIIASATLTEFPGPQRSTRELAIPIAFQSLGHTRNIRPHNLMYWSIVK